MPSTAATGPLAARIAKRGIDLAGAIVGLVVLSPVLAWIALILVLTQGRPVLFRNDQLPVSVRGAARAGSFRPGRSVRAAARRDR